MKWLQHLSMAVTYIEEHLDQDISYDTAAEIACCSTYYFQRVFSYVAGISLSEYIRRRRMTQAAFDLQRTDKKVLEIALTYGYTSPTSFHRAFQRVHGISPAAARNTGAVLNAYPPIKLCVQVSGEQPLSYRIERREAMRILGFRTSFTKQIEENQKKAPLFLKQVLQEQRLNELQTLSDGRIPGILGASIYEQDDHIHYDIAVTSSAPASAPLYEYEIPSATWAVFPYDGAYQKSIPQIFRCIWTQWLSFSGFEYAGLPDLEVYPLLEDGAQGSHFEVWIAIKKGE